VAELPDRDALGRFLNAKDGTVESAFLDELLASAIDSVQRDTGREFRTGVEPQTRIARAAWPVRLHRLPGDLREIASVHVDGVAVDISTVQLRTLPGEPVAHSIWLPNPAREVEVTGLWGWPADGVPADVAHAVTFHAARSYHRARARTTTAIETPDGGAMYLPTGLPGDVAATLRNLRLPPLP
jgi:hypothetical protein